MPGKLNLNEQLVSCRLLSYLLLMNPILNNLLLYYFKSVQIQRRCSRQRWDSEDLRGVSSKRRPLQDVAAFRNRRRLLGRQGDSR